MIQSGSGIFQVDFINYNFKAGQSIFLSPGQYFQLLSGGYNILQYEFEEKDVRHIENSRFLFKHLVSIGHIDIKQSEQLYKSQLRNIDVFENNNIFKNKTGTDLVYVCPCVCAECTFTKTLNMCYIY